MIQANLGQQIGYRLRGEPLNRMDLYVSQGIIAGNIEHIAESAQSWRMADHQQYVALVQQMERLGSRASAQTITLTNAAEQQTQAIRDLNNRFGDIGVDIQDGMSQIQNQLASCEIAIQNGFNLTIEAIENLHKEITNLLRRPQATRAHELISLAEKRLANAIVNPRFEKEDVAHAERLINEALESPVGQTISQAWYLRGWLELNTFNEPQKAITSFENARRVAQKNSEALIPFLYYCKAIRATGNLSDQLVEECIKCLHIAALCPSLRNETSIEIFSMIFESIQANQIPPEDMQWLRRRIDPKLEGILGQSPHLLPRLFVNADSESKNTLLRLYRDLCNNARSECQNMVDSAESILDFMTKLHRYSPADFSHEINAMNRLKQEARVVLPEKEAEWKNSFKNILGEIDRKLASTQTILQEKISAIQRRIQALETQYETECKTYHRGGSDPEMPKGYLVMAIIGAMIGIWIDGLLIGLILFVVFGFGFALLVDFGDSRSEKQAKTKASINYNRAIAHVEHPGDLKLQTKEIDQFRNILFSIRSKYL